MSRNNEIIIPGIVHPQIGVPNQGPKSGSQMGVTNGGPKLGSQIRVPKQDPKWGSQTGVPNGGPKWGSQMGVPNGGPKWGSQMGVPNGGVPNRGPKSGSKIGVPNGGPKWGCPKSRSKIGTFCMCFFCTGKYSISHEITLNISYFYLHRKMQVIGLLLCYFDNNYVLHKSEN
jgi:hypothetical protein